MKWSRLTVNLEPALAELAKKRASAQRRSFAAYVAKLIEDDTQYLGHAPAGLLAAEDKQVSELLGKMAPEAGPQPVTYSTRKISPRPAQAKR